MIRTVANKNIDRVKDNLSEICDILYETIKDSGTNGLDDYNAEYRTKLIDALPRLLRLKEDL